MEGLGIAHVDGHVRSGKLLGVIEGAHLQNHDTRDRRDPAQDMRSAVRTKLARDRRIKIAAREAGWLTRRVSKPLVSKPKDQIRSAARYVLALSAVTLPFDHRIARHRVSKLAAIASPFSVFVRFCRSSVVPLPPLKAALA